MGRTGSVVGNFELGNSLGRGGMGEVYRARDKKLGREVAIKVLPEEFSRDADRVARFQREAKLLASLNHPNIAAIYGLEESGGMQFLVLELVEGETLADQVKRGPIPVEESLKLALQIAEALEAAHEKGVIHRDLKPANIKVTPEGKAKVLDFGLAKAFAGEPTDLNLSNSPTLSQAATQQGVILGTAAYMSPEQARGKPVDKRTDIWAFGCVLFEMLTGRAAFSGKDVTDILAAVIRAEPEWSSLPANLHWRLREVLERCLKKDSKDRYHDIADVRADLQKVLSDPGGALVQPGASVEAKSGLRLRFPWVVAFVALAAIIAGVAVWKLKPSEPRQVMRFDYELPEGQQFSDLQRSVLAVSPDGKQFAYSTPKGLYLRSVDEWTAKLIPGTEGSTQAPFFSPDGKSIGYFSVGDTQLKKIAINGGAPVSLCNVAQLWGASWSADSTIVYGRLGGDIMRISADGGTPETFIKVKSGWGVLPQILPDGKSVLYSTVASGLQTSIMLQSLKSGEPRELFPGIGARYLPTGHIVYKVRGNNNLFAIPFDPGRMQVAGGTVPIIEGVAGTGAVANPQFAVSETGTLVYIPGTLETAATGRTLVWVDRNGKEEPLAAAPDAYSSPRISPDGTRVALAVGSGETDIHIWDLSRRILTRLTFDKGQECYPFWTPDGKRIVFASDRGGNPGLYWKAADGTGEIEKLSSTSSYRTPSASWSGGGKVLVYEEIIAEKGGGDIFVLSMEGERVKKPLLQERYIEGHQQISPNGRWMAYASNESGQFEVYVCPFPDVSKGKWQVSTNGGQQPRWSPDGREMFYRNGDAMMAVAVETEPAFSKAGLPKELFRGYYFSEIGHQWDLSRDGKRFLMIKEAGAAASTAAGPRKINIVLNWFEELKQRVPIK